MWLAEGAGESAAWALVTARGWLAFTLAGDNPNSWVGLVTFMTMIPYVLVPFLTGLLADRIVRRDLLAWGFVINILQTLALALLVLTNVIEMWHLVFLALVNGCARAVEFSAAESMAANLVPKEHLINAYSLLSAVFYATRLLGPGIIAPLMSVLDPGWIFIICTNAYLLGLYLVLNIRTKSTGVVEPTKSALYNIFSGLRYTYVNSILRSIILLVLFHCALTMSFESLLPVISDTQLGEGGGGVAYLNMAVGLGALLVSIGIAPVRGEGLRGRLLLTLGIASALSPLILAVAPSLAIGMLATTGIGASQAGFMIIASSMIQSVVPDGLRGRVTSIYLLHAGGIMSFANFANGSLADVFEPGWILAISGLSFIGVILISAFRATARSIYITGVPASAIAASE